ncbi:MAG: histidine--tRNA ligase [Bacteroidales bacterium]|jgi:histidyl-tRNA synthetase|nr:histidine--tRNA ligase [Bacteroidales bacterium]NMD04181.1 histidine--tRNA ligase [Bacteroidales bacterium]OQB61966.1 MAG: Histidine--tRNA ligase [Bacteroidetes bacterium ADurb.Bin145]HOU01934.1 histidine--tRNA ligase [Bacteroidales bacterium]HQK67292.1 histidine--tRNA ligase [Bacteroidales bacterium]
MANKPSIPKGTRDFSPEEILRREFIFDTIRDVFKLYGYLPLETPAMENLSTLLGKYGEEGDRLIFKILNSGDFLSDVAPADLEERNTAKLSGVICEKGLRYDLTVPFARYIVQHRDEIIFPFRRYQIQPVWRADRPQKGRYREFFQCDVDVIGSDSLLNEYELIKIIDEIFSKLKVSVITKINNRKLLAGISEYIGEENKLTDITIAIDKIEKIGIEAVNRELMEKGISAEALNKLQPVLKLEGGAGVKLDKLKSLLSNSVTGIKGIAELNELFSYIETGILSGSVELDLTLARGLNYYTGTIIEVKSADISIGSICGGGRYDNLTGVFGMDGISGVGVSFGADRIYDVMNQLSLFSNSDSSLSKVLVLNFGDAVLEYSFKILALLRSMKIRSEFYPDPVKIKKQISYADARKIPYILIAGEDELKSGFVTIRNMISGQQQKVPMADLRGYLSSEICKGRS